VTKSRVISRRVGVEGSMLNPFLISLPGCLVVIDPRRIRYRCSSRTATLGDDASGPHTEAAVASRSCRFDIAGTGGGRPDASSLLFREDDDEEAQHFEV
jgi:hypothetical protein